MTTPTTPQTLKARIEADLRAAMKSRDELVTSTLRMAITAVRNAEVAGAQARALADDEVLAVLTREAKKRREAAAAFADAGRAEQAAKERAEEEVLERYLPSQLSDDELRAIVADVMAAGGFSGMPSMGAAMKAAQVIVAGRAEGGRVAAEVRRQLS
ncbi:MAG TPA: GatB/YqeY domain-containing protein [Micromonosporaceae bacterium]|nr:GatB/YqeY domain-containing protein [Micromonosporaceae bacterium]